MNAISVKEAAQKWGVTTRRVQDLCKQGRIPGAQRWERSWMIPRDAVYPTQQTAHIERLPMPRKSPFLDMTDLYKTPGTANQCIAALEGQPEAQQLFAAQIAYSRGQIDEVYDHMQYFLQVHSGFYAILGGGLLLSLCAMWHGDIVLWQKARQHLQEAPCKSDADRDIVTMAVAAADSAKTDGKIFTDESSLSENKKDLDDYAFEFVLAKLDGTVIETVTDNGAGFEFKNITYSEVGQTQYLIYEKPTGKAGITYDSAKYRVTVTVTDGGNGLLEATVKYEKAESSESGDYETVSGVLFENTYKAKETSVTFGGKKTLTGRELKENDFSFTLKTASGEEIETVKNDAEGIFCFKTVTYYNEGTFTYTLEEVKGNAEGITYDDAKYTLTVTVTDVEGELKATTEIRKDGKVADSVGFTNIYTPKAPEPTEPPTEAPTEAPTEPPTEAPTEAPTEPAPEGGAQVPPNDDPGNTGTNSGNENIDIPEDEPPKTGDDSHVGRWTLMMAVSAIGVLAVLVLGKKKLFEQ